MLHGLCASIEKSVLIGRHFGRHVWHGLGLLLIAGILIDTAIAAAGNSYPVYAPAGLVFYSIAGTTILAFFLINTGLKNRPGIYYSGVFAAMLALIWALEGGLKAHGLGGEFEADIAITIGFLCAAFGFFAAQASINPDRKMPKTQTVLKALTIISLVQIPIIWVSSWQPMANVANLLLVTMFAAQVIPAMTSRTHDNRRQIIQVTAAVIGAILTVAALTLFLAGVAREYLPSPAMFRFLFAAVAIPTMAGVVAALVDMRRARDKALLASVEAAQRDAETSAALLEMEQNYARAREVADGRTHQLSTASHDIRQPIASLRAEIDALRQSDAGASFDRFDKIIDHIDRLSADLSNQAKHPIEAGLHGEVDVETVPIALLFDTLEKMFDVDAERRGIDLIFEAQADSVNAPPLVLMRILSNLISNALAHAQPKTIRVRAQDIDRMIKIGVSDDGAGFDTMNISDAFQTGIKGPGSEGDGLGLSIVRELADTYGFQVDVISAADTGTSIAILIPH